MPADSPPKVDTSPQTVEQLVAVLRGKDENARTAAWFAAGPVGAAGVGPLAALMGDADREVARAGRNGLLRIVHHAGRDGAGAERQAVETQLLAVLKGGAGGGGAAGGGAGGGGAAMSAACRSSILWMLSEAGSDACVPAVAAWLADKDCREAARAALERIGSPPALAALKAALAAAEDDYKPALAASLRACGQTVDGVPCVQLTPCRATSVKEVQK